MFCEKSLNLFDTSNARQDVEVSVILCQTSDVRIEKILSMGHSSLETFWYDQEENEWVSVLQGWGEVLFEGETTPHRLCEGDTLFIPSHRRHKVTATSNEGVTIWLVAFFS